MSFLTYQQARPWAKAIKEAVLLKKMPPWFADPKYGHFRNDRTLAQKDIDTLVSWADLGASEGNPKDLPKPIAFVPRWARRFQSSRSATSNGCEAASSKRRTRVR